MKLRFAIASSVVIAAFASSFEGANATAGVIVVDPLGGYGAPQLSAALIAAQDGDIVVVRPGVYVSPSIGDYHVTGKSISLIADSATKIALSGLFIQSAATGTVVIRGFAFPAGRIGLYQNTATVWIEDCDSVGTTASASQGFAGIWSVSSGGAGATIDSCARVVMQRCSMTGGDGVADTVFPQAGAIGGGEGVTVTHSSIVLDGCTLLGGDAGACVFSTFSFYNLARAGIRLDQSSSCWISGSMVRGGGGSTPECFVNGPAAAMSVFDSASVARSRDNVFVPGDFNGGGSPAPPISGSLANVITYPAPARSFAMPAIVKSGSTGMLSILGKPLDNALVLVSAATSISPIPSGQGALVLAPGTFVGPIVVGTITQASGQLAIPFLAPPLPPGVLGVLAFVQGAIGNGHGTIAAASMTMIADPSL